MRTEWVRLLIRNCIGGLLDRPAFAHGKIGGVILHQRLQKYQCPFDHPASQQKPPKARLLWAVNYFGISFSSCHSMDCVFSAASCVASM